MHAHEIAYMQNARNAIIKPIPTRLLTNHVLEYAMLCEKHKTCEQFSEKAPFWALQGFTTSQQYAIIYSARGCSSAGRARQSHCRGQGFEPPHLHRNHASSISDYSGFISR